VSEVTKSGLRGRVARGFPPALSADRLDTPSELKFIACNADEGDSGTFADRMLIEVIRSSWWKDGHRSARRRRLEGYVYIRSEYPDAIATMQAAIDIAYLNGWIGPTVLGSSRAFDSTCVSGLAPTSAARRQPCWKAWRVAGAS